MIGQLAGADLLAATLKDTGPHAQMWCPIDGGGSAFYARRFAYETAMHPVRSTSGVDGIGMHAFPFRGAPVDA
jgi:hypothetical protein